MQLLDCNDASLRLWRDDQDTFSIGIAWFDEHRYHFGDSAWRQARRAPRAVNNRYWHRLSTQPLSPALGPARHTADLVHAHLEALLADTSGEITLVIPGVMEPAQLSLLLGILQTLPATPTAVVHRSALIGAGQGEACAHVELHLHQASVTAVAIADHSAIAGETQLLPGSGLLGLIDEIAEIIGQQFVSQTRFDPQRRADTEQSLYEQIPSLLRSLAAQGEVSCAVEGHTARINTEMLRPVGQYFSAALAPLIPAGTSLIALDSLLAVLPGLSLSSATGEALLIRTVTPEAITKASASLPPPGGELVFQRQVGCVSADTAATDTTPQARITMPAITHYLVAGRAKPLTAGAIIATGITVVSAGEIAIAEGADATLNNAPVDGVIHPEVGDTLMASGVEVHFIAVES